MTDTFPSVALGHVAMNTPDVDRSRQFYEDVLGWRTILVDHPPHAPFRRMATLVAPSGAGPLLLLFEVPVDGSGVADDTDHRSRVDHRRVDHLAFVATSTHEFEAVVERLIAAGTSSGHVDTHGPTQSVEFVDPHGGHHHLQMLVEGWHPDASTEVLDPDLLALRFGAAALAPNHP